MGSTEASGTVVIKPLPGQGPQPQASHAEEEEEEEEEEGISPPACMHGLVLVFAVSAKTLENFAMVRSNLWLSGMLPLSVSQTELYFLAYP